MTLILQPTKAPFSKRGPKSRVPSRPAQKKLQPTKKVHRRRSGALRNTDGGAGGGERISPDSAEHVLTAESETATSKRARDEVVGNRGTGTLGA